MKLNVYKNQKEIEKTYETDAYDLMYGTVEDLFELMDDVEDMKDEMELVTAIQKHRKKLVDLLLDVFGDQGITEEELRRIKLKELVPFFTELFAYVKDSFGDGKN